MFVSLCVCVCVYVCVFVCVCVCANRGRVQIVKTVECPRDVFIGPHQHCPSRLLNSVNLSSLALFNTALQDCQTLLTYLHWPSSTLPFKTVKLCLLIFIGPLQHSPSRLSNSVYLSSLALFNTALQDCQTLLTYLHWPSSTLPFKIVKLCLLIFIGPLQHCPSRLSNSVYLSSLALFNTALQDCQTLFTYLHWPSSTQPFKTVKLCLLIFIGPHQHCPSRLSNSVYLSSLALFNTALQDCQTLFTYLHWPSSTQLFKIVKLCLLIFIGPLQHSPSRLSNSVYLSHNKGNITHSLIV